MAKIDKDSWRQWIAEAVTRALSPVFNVGAESGGWVHFVRLGVRDEQFLQWARAHGYRLQEVWGRCPRADWLLQLALGAQLRREMVQEGVERCLELMDEVMRADGRTGFARPAGEARRALRRWTWGAARADELQARFSEALVFVLDNSDRLRRVRRRAAFRVTRSMVFAGQEVEVDDEEQAFLHQLAAELRACIPYEELRVAVYYRGRREGGPPYR